MARCQIPSESGVEVHIKRVCVAPGKYRWCYGGDIYEDVEGKPQLRMRDRGRQCQLPGWLQHHIEQIKEWLVERGEDEWQGYCYESTTYEADVDF
jgi:hypothetical protein